MGDSLRSRVDQVLREELARTGDDAREVCEDCLALLALISAPADITPALAKAVHGFRARAGLNSRMSNDEFGQRVDAYLGGNLPLARILERIHTLERERLKAGHALDPAVQRFLGMTQVPGMDDLGDSSNAVPSGPAARFALRKFEK